MPDYWLFVTDEENWRICLQNETWGTHDGHKSKFEKIQLNDIIIVYIKVLKILRKVSKRSTIYYHTIEPVFSRNFNFYMIFLFQPVMILLGSIAKSYNTKKPP